MAAGGSRSRQHQSQQLCKRVSKRRIAWRESVFISGSGENGARGGIGLKARVDIAYCVVQEREGLSAVEKASNRQ